MTLAQQPPGDSGASAPDTRHYPTVFHHHPSPVVLQGAPQQQQVASYMVAGPSGGHPGVLQGQPVPLPTPGPNHTYPSSTPGPAAFPGSSLNQQLLQQHTYIQQPVQQVGTFSRASECAHSSAVSHSTVETSVMTNPFSSCWEVDSNGTADGVTQSLNSCCVSFPDVGVLLLVSPPPPLLQPAAALPAPHQPAL